MSVLSYLASGGLLLIRSIALFDMITGQVLELVFGFSVYSVAVVETLPWTLSGAWENFTVAIILMAGGLLVLGYSMVKKRTTQSIFLFVWSVVMLLLTIRFQRFQYYLTVNVVILAAICIVEPIELEKRHNNPVPRIFHFPVIQIFEFLRLIPKGINQVIIPLREKKIKRRR